MVLETVSHVLRKEKCQSVRSREDGKSNSVLAEHRVSPHLMPNKGTTAESLSTVARLLDTKIDNVCFMLSESHHDTRI